MTELGKSKLVRADILNEILDCDLDTGCLTWRTRGADFFPSKKRSPEHSANNWNKKYAGKEAFFSVNADGYLYGRIFRRQYMAHRVIWAMSNGVWPRNQIDHIDGVRSNNRLLNLRDVTHTENNKNRGITNRNTSGIVGVSWNIRKEKWVAYITVSGTFISLGYHSEKHVAEAARKAAEVKYGFHENHGRAAA